MADVILANTDSSFVDSTAGAPAYAANELRLADAALLIAPGICRDSDTALSVSVDGADNVTVQAGACAIEAADGSGYYRTGTSSAVSGLLPARDATYSRIDLIVYEQLDPLGADRRAQISIIAGDPSATPGVPAAPTEAVELGRITVPKSGGGAATVDLSHRRYACASGGVLAVPSAARLPATAPLYQRAVSLDDAVEHVFDGTDWQEQDTGWQTPTLASPWTASSQAPRYRRINGVVYLDGRVEDGAASSTIFTLPVGYRPSQALFIRTTQGGINADARLQVAAGGVVSVDNMSPGQEGNQLSIVCSFPVD